MTDRTEGWGWPANARKAHYYIEGRSLCAKWAFFGSLSLKNDASPDNCAECKRQKAKRDATASGNGA